MKMIALIIVGGSWGWLLADLFKGWSGHASPWHPWMPLVPLLILWVLLIINR